MRLGKVFWIGLVLFLVAMGGVLASKRVSPMSWGWYGRVNAPGGIAINGYDPVAYHTTGQPTPGDPAITATWNDATWRFATKANQAKFTKAPEKYAPQFGGFCGFAASRGATAKCEPTAWKIEGGKLYLFNDATFRDKWLAELNDGIIAKGEANWARH